MVIKLLPDVLKNLDVSIPRCVVTALVNSAGVVKDIPLDSAVVSLVPGKDLGLIVSKLISGNNTDYLVQFVCRCGRRAQLGVVQ